MDDLLVKSQVALNDALRAKAEAESRLVDAQAEHLKAQTRQLASEERAGTRA